MTRVTKYEKIILEVMKVIRTVELSANKQLELLNKLVHERDDALETIKQRDKEINALKHMLDRLDGEGEEK